MWLVFSFKAVLDDKLYFYYILIGQSYVPFSMNFNTITSHTLNILLCLLHTLINYTIIDHKSTDYRRSNAVDSLDSLQYLTIYPCSFAENRITLMTLGGVLD